MKLMKKIKNNKLLAVIVLAYIMLFIFAPDKGIASIKNSLYYFSEMLQILPIIFVLTALIETWIPRDTIVASFGEGSGIKGSLLSFVIGTLSAGPLYAAFPLCKVLLKKGASVMNIVIIISTWAVIKLPMLINEAKFLGVQFMAVRWVLTVFTIFIMAYFMGKVTKRESLPVLTGGNLATEKTDDLPFRVHGDYCMGCGLCYKMEPRLFEQDGKKAMAKAENYQVGDARSIEEIAKRCPTKAIQISFESQAV